MSKDPKLNNSQKPKSTNKWDRGFLGHIAIIHDIIVEVIFGLLLNPILFFIVLPVSYLIYGTVHREILKDVFSNLLIYYLSYLAVSFSLMFIQYLVQEYIYHYVEPDQKLYSYSSYARLSGYDMTTDEYVLVSFELSKESQRGLFDLRDLCTGRELVMEQIFDTKDVDYPLEY